MDLRTAEERWTVWMVQARRFAERENFTDAVARMKLVHAAVQEALGKVTDPRQRERLERHLARASEQLTSMQSQYQAWRSEIAVRRQHTIDQAAEEMARPLPASADEPWLFLTARLRRSKPESRSPARQSSRWIAGCC